MGRRSVLERLKSSPLVRAVLIAVLMMQFALIVHGFADAVSVFDGNTTCDLARCRDNDDGQDQCPPGCPNCECTRADLAAIPSPGQRAQTRAFIDHEVAPIREVVIALDIGIRTAVFRPPRASLA